MTKRNRNKINYNVSDDNQIKSFIIILIIILIVTGIIYGVTEIFKKDKQGENVKGEVSINYSKLTVGTIFSSVYDHYYVLIYNSKDTNAARYSMLMSKFVSDNNDKKMYYIDLNNGLNKEYYNKNNDNISNKHAKSIDEFDFNDFTLIEISNKNIIKYIDDYDEISKYLFNK